MATSTIKSVTLYEDGIVEIVVICDTCGSFSITITHAVTTNRRSSRLIDSSKTIDFSKLESHICHGDNCYANYNLY